MLEGCADAAAETILRDGLTHSITMRCAHKAQPLHLNVVSTQLHTAKLAILNHIP